MKTRFAPSPTGYLHFGNLRTALFNALLAKHDKGIFLLRIEDTDQTRSTKEFVTEIENDLTWLGLHWQEGPTVGGKHTPYFQSQRQAIYDNYYHQLEQAGWVYPCFCSDQELAIARKVQLAAGQPPRYQGTCRNLTAKEIAAKQAKNVAFTLRFRVPDNEIIVFEDFVRGTQNFSTNEIGDFIISRSDRTPAFFFCNAIDDALMEITHVLRGDDHLTNTPRQLLILRALKLYEPQYGHLPLIVGNDGAPLSKRHGSRNMKELREEGYLPGALLNYAARLGHYYRDNDFMNFEQLSAQFSLSALGKAPARFDLGQLLYWQKQAVQHLETKDFWRWLGTDIQNFVPAAAKDTFITAVRGNLIFPADAYYWAKILFTSSLVYTPEALHILKQAGARYLQIAQEVFVSENASFNEVSSTLQKILNLKGKALFQPLRIALTGELHGPEMAHLIELLGKEKILQRLKHAENCMVEDLL